ncbi:MAG TPA: tetratricopeptide repeat protein, partial [Blastocatellia bacterium]
MRQMISFALAGWILLAGLPGRQQVQQGGEAGERLRRAGALFDQRRFAEAAEEARRARESDPKLREAWKLSGLSLQLAGSLQEAEKEFAAALHFFPNDPDLWFYLARVQYLQSSLKPAESSARRALDLQPDHAGAHTQLAMALEALNDYPKALDHYRRGVELGRKLGRPPTLPLVYAANLLLKLNRVEEALDYLTQAEAIEPQSREIRLSRGRALEKLGRLAEAEKEYQQAATNDGGGQSSAARAARAALARLNGLRAGATGNRGAGKPIASIAPIRFRDVAGQSRLDFVLRNDASPRKYQVETMTGGLAVID